MTSIHRLSIFLAICLLFTCIPFGVSAFTVSSVTIDPPGNQAAGTAMTVRSVIDFSSSGNGTFPPASELQMSTDLSKPYWVPVLVLDGKDTHMEITAGESLTIPGLYLSYPPSQNMQLLVTVTGNIPPDPSPKQNLLQIQELDSSMNVVSTAHIAMPEAPMMPLSTPSLPTKKPTIKKTFTPIATETPTSPGCTGAGIIAIMGAALLGMRRK